jgi:HSP20 family molecular chaperone IbpA
MEKNGFPYSLSIDGDLLRIVTELPGISEEKIRLDIDGTTLTISADDRGRQLKTCIALPWQARLGTKRCRKGVLELTLEKYGR